MIKTQHNTVSERKQYKKNSFISIAHEHIIIFKKNDVWSVLVKITQTRVFDIRTFENVTWRDLVQAALEFLGNEANLAAIYNLIKDSKKAIKNKHWKEKIRQILQLHENFQSTQREYWKLKIA